RRHDQGHRRGVRVGEFRRRVSGLYLDVTPDRRHADVQPGGGGGRRRNHGRDQHDDDRRDDLLHHRRNGPRNVVDGVHGARRDHGGRHDQGDRHRVGARELRGRLGGLYPDDDPDRRHADVQPRGGSRRRRDHGHDQHDDGRRDDLLHHRRNGPRNVVDGVHGARRDHGGRHDQGDRHRVGARELRGRLGGLYPDDDPDRRHADVQPRGGSRRRRDHGHDQHDDGRRDDLLHHRRNGPRNVVDGVHGARRDHGGRHDQGDRHRVGARELRGRLGGLYPDDDPDRRHADVQPRGGSRRRRDHGHDQHDDGRRDDLLHHRRNGPRALVDDVRDADYDHDGDHNQSDGHGAGVRGLGRSVGDVHHRGGGGDADVQSGGGSG